MLPICNLPKKYKTEEVSYKMELNYFKDKIFDLLNESDELDLSDIRVDDRRGIFTIHTTDGSVFELLCRQK